ncbi:MAG: glycosyltransferase family 2 protein [Clostridia bacterium]|nr:glycosyltransferase family 2 protein [Clostridia bacterium]
MIKVSVIVPAYNVEKYIEKCLNTLVNQTLKEIEIIVVNDGSTDNTKEKIEEFTTKYPEKIIYLEKENGGLSDARNFGMPYAKGEYIGCIDSDDYIEENMYEEMYKKAKEENSDMVECDFIWEYPNSKRIDVGKIYNNKKEAMLYARVVAWNKIIRKEIIEKQQAQYPKGLRYEDVEFFYKILPSLEKISFVKKPLIHYIQRENSIANTQNERVKEIFDIWDNVLEFYKKNNLYDEYEQELEYTYTRFLLCSSLLRIVRVADKEKRKELEKRTWEELNKKFPIWKENIYLKTEKGKKNLYLKTVNKATFKIYCKIFEKRK